MESYHQNTICYAETQATIFARELSSAVTEITCKIDVHQHESRKSTQFLLLCQRGALIFAIYQFVWYLLHKCSNRQQSYSKQKFSHQAPYIPFNTVYVSFPCSSQCNQIGLLKRTNNRSGFLNFYRHNKKSKETA